MSSGTQAPTLSDTWRTVTAAIAIKEVFDRVGIVARTVKLENIRSFASSAARPYSTARSARPMRPAASARQSYVLGLVLPHSMARRQACIAPPLSPTDKSNTP